MGWFKDLTGIDSGIGEGNVGYLDPTSGNNVWSDIDPTTSEGLTNLVTGPISIPTLLLTGGKKNIGKKAVKAGSQLDDSLSGRAAQDKIDEAAEEAAAAQQDIIQLYKDQYADYISRAQPYSDLGADAVKQLQAFMSPEAQAQYAQEALQGQAFQNIQEAALNPLISNSAALGNRLSSGIQEDVLNTSGALATGYAQDMINQRIAQLTQGVNTGLSALSGTGSAGSAMTTGSANAMNNIANINLQAANAAAMQPNLLGGLLGAGLGGLVGGPTGAGIGYNIGSNV